MLIVEDGGTGICEHVGILLEIICQRDNILHQGNQRNKIRKQFFSYLNPLKLQSVSKWGSGSDGEGKEEKEADG